MIFAIDARFPHLANEQMRTSLVQPITEEVHLTLLVWVDVNQGIGRSVPVPLALHPFLEFSEADDLIPQIQEKKDLMAGEIKHMNCDITFFHVFHLI